MIVATMQFCVQNGNCENLRYKIGDSVMNSRKCSLNCDITLEFQKLLCFMVACIVIQHFNNCLRTTFYKRCSKELINICIHRRRHGHPGAPKQCHKLYPLLFDESTVPENIQPPVPAQVPGPMDAFVTERDAVQPHRFRRQRHHSRNSNHTSLAKREIAPAVLFQGAGQKQIFLWQCG